MLHKLKNRIRETFKPVIQLYTRISEYIYLQVIKHRISLILNEEILSMTRESLGLNNLVYSFTTPSGKYIYKEFVQINKDEERMAHALFSNLIIYEDFNIRIEKFIKGRSPEYLMDAYKIVNSISKIHQMQINIKRFSELILLSFSQEVIFYKKEHKLILLSLYKKIAEVYKSNSPYLVICHNDLQPGNLIINDSAVIIDFEYAAYAPPHYEFANLFCEMSYDTELNYMVIDRMPTKEEKLLFLKYYFPDPIKELRTVDELMCVSHFFWYIWARMCHRKRKEALRYDEYARKRLLFLNLEGYLSNFEYEELLSDLNEI